MNEAGDTTGNKLDVFAQWWAEVSGNEAFTLLISASDVAQCVDQSHDPNARS